MTAPALPRVRLDLPSELAVAAARDSALVEAYAVAPELTTWHAQLASADVELVAVRVGAAPPLSLVVAVAALPAGPDDVVLQGLLQIAAGRTGHAEVLDLHVGSAVASARVTSTERGPAALAEVHIPVQGVLLVLTVCSPEPTHLPECASVAAAVASRVRAE